MLRVCAPTQCPYPGKARAHSDSEALGHLLVAGEGARADMKQWSHTPVHPQPQLAERSAGCVTRTLKRPLSLRSWTKEQVRCSGDPAAEHSWGGQICPGLGGPAGSVTEGPPSCPQQVSTTQLSHLWVLGTRHWDRETPSGHVLGSDPLTAGGPWGCGIGVSAPAGHL